MKYKLPLSRYIRTNKLGSILAALIVATIGVYLLSSSHAATPYGSIEAENGSLKQGATTQTDSNGNASGGSYVQFGSVESSVDDFLDSEGVNIHSSYSTTPYEDGKLTLATLQALGIHNVRDNISISPSTTETANLQLLQQDGVTFDFTIGAADSTRISPLISEIEHNFLPGTIGIEGANEWDNNHGANWVSEDTDVQTNLYGMVHSDPSLSNVSVVGPSLVGDKDSTDAALLGNQSAVLDLGNIHSYPATGTPESTIGKHIAAESLVSGTKPIWATESGYNPCLDCTTGNPPIPVDETAQAALVPRIYLSDFQAKVQKTYLYELFDENTDTTNYQNDWGVANYTTSSTVSLKPAGQAVANMNAVLSHDNLGAALVPRLDYDIQGDSNLQSLILTKHTSVGDVYDLIVWEDTSPWNFQTKQEITVPGVSFKISFGSAMNVAKYEPASQAMAINTYNNVVSLTDSATPDIAIYEISAP